MSKSYLLFFCFMILSAGLLNAQPAYTYEGKEYQWEDVTEFKEQIGLPDPFLKPDGTRVQSKEEWTGQQKYIKAMLAHYQYGTMPPAPEHPKVKETLSEDLFDGLATRKLYTLTLKRNNKSVDFHFGLIKPNGDGPFPVIIKNDRDVPDPINHDKAKVAAGSLDIPEEALLDLLNRGYVYCAYNREDLSPDIYKDREACRKQGIFPLYPEYNWGTIAVWAWGYQLIIDYFEQLGFIDMDKIVVTGHSRGGKTALCGGIYDERIAITAPNSSGLGGTASHLYNETTSAGYPCNLTQTIIQHKNVTSHWWADEYYKIAGYEALAPFDAHFGMTVLAPRAFFNTHAYQDYWANPLGAWLCCAAAKKVYKWLDAENNIAMHFRTGKHAQGILDCLALLDFSDQYFFNKKPSSKYDVEYDFNKVNPYPWAPIPVKWEVPDEK